MFKVIKRIMHFANILEHALSFLECMVNEHVFVNLVSLGVNLGLLYLLVSTGVMIPQWAQVVAIVGSTLVNFVLNKVWTFAP